MKEDSSDGGGGCGGDPRQSPSQAPASKDKSCKGCLSYSSVQRSEASNPLCVGITRTLQQDASVHSQPRGYSLTQSSGQDFLSKFTRNAGLVASGVVRNLFRVGNQIKDNFDDILYDRWRPK